MIQLMISVQKPCHIAGNAHISRNKTKLRFLWMCLIFILYDKTENYTLCLSYTHGHDSASK